MCRTNWPCLRQNQVERQNRWLGGNDAEIKMHLWTYSHPRTHACTHARTHPPTHPRTHAPTHPRTHAHTHTIILTIWLNCSSRPEKVIHHFITCHLCLGHCAGHTFQNLSNGSWLGGERRTKSRIIWLDVGEMASDIWDGLLKFADLYPGPGGVELRLPYWRDLFPQLCGNRNYLPPYASVACAVPCVVPFALLPDVGTWAVEIAVYLQHHGAWPPAGLWHNCCGRLETHDVLQAPCPEDFYRQTVQFCIGFLLSKNRLFTNCVGLVGICQPISVLNLRGRP